MHHRNLKSLFLVNIFAPLGLVKLLLKSCYKVCNLGTQGAVVTPKDLWGTREFRDVKGKERVPVPVAGPAFRGGVKFVKFYVFGSFLQPAAKIGPVQRAFPPVGNPSLGEEREKKVTLIIKMVEKLQKVPRK